MIPPQPTVAVVIPTRNRREMVAGAVESVLAQDPPAAEVIVVDDASTDGTAEALRERFGERIDVIRSETNIERGAARNLGARSSSAELIAFLDSDDEWAPGKLVAQIGERSPVTVTG